LSVVIMMSVPRSPAIFLVLVLKCVAPWAKPDCMANSVTVQSVKVAASQNARPLAIRVCHYVIQWLPMRRLFACSRPPPQHLCHGWKSGNATASITTTTTTTAPSLASVSINIVLTIKNLPFSKLLANNVATPVLLAIKEAIAVEAGDQISAEMVSATLAANPASATATSVSAKVITPEGIPGDLVQQKLASNTGLGKSIASWVSWADGVATVQAGSIKVSNLVVASAAESITTPGPTNVLAQFGEHRIVLSTLNHPSLLSLLMIAIGMCACCACALSTFVRLRQRKQHRSAAGGWQLVDVQEEVASERFQLGHQPSLLTRYMSSSSSPHQSGRAAENYAAYDALE